MAEISEFCHEALSGGDYNHGKTRALQANRDGMFGWLNTRRVEGMTKVTDSATYTLFQVASKANLISLSLVGREMRREGIFQV